MPTLDEWAQQHREFWEKALSFAIPASIATNSYGSTSMERAAAYADEACRQWEMRFPKPKAKGEVELPEFVEFCEFFGDDLTNETRIYNCLHNEGLVDRDGYLSLRRLAGTTQAELRRIKNLGTKSIKEIAAAAEKKGIRIV